MQAVATAQFRFDFDRISTLAVHAVGAQEGGAQDAAIPLIDGEDFVLVCHGPSGFLAPRFARVMKGVSVTAS